MFGFAFFKNLKLPGFLYIHLKFLFLAYPIIFIYKFISYTQLYSIYQFFIIFLKNNQLDVSNIRKYHQNAVFKL